MAVEGSLSYMDIAHLLNMVGTSRKSGVLTIRYESREARLFFQQGHLTRAASNQICDGIGSLLVEAGHLNADDLERALEVQRQEGGIRRLGVILFEDFSIRHEDIQSLLLEQARRIVFDVFSWPGGSFSFRADDPAADLDRFHHDPVDLIHEVGIQAGLLAAEGSAWERAVAGGRH